MTTTAPDFHPRAASAALAKFVAESDEPSALELLAPLNPDQLRDLIRASAELVYGASRTLCQLVEAMTRHAIGHSTPKGDDALGFAEVAVNLLMLAAREPSDVSDALAEAVAHQMLEHPYHDDSECLNHDHRDGCDHLEDDDAEYVCVRCGREDGPLRPVYVCEPDCLDPRGKVNP